MATTCKKPVLSAHSTCALKTGSGPDLLRAGTLGSWGAQNIWGDVCFWNLRSRGSWPRGLDQDGRHRLVPESPVRHDDVCLSFGHDVQRGTVF